jgi:hypothetical protein
MSGKPPDAKFLKSRGFKRQFNIGGVQKWSTPYSEGKPWFELYLNDKDSFGRRKDSLRSYGGWDWVTAEASMLTRTMIDEALAVVQLTAEVTE